MILYNEPYLLKLNYSQLGYNMLTAFRINRQELKPQHVSIIPSIYYNSGSDLFIPKLPTHRKQNYLLMLSVIGAGTKIRITPFHFIHVHIISGILE